MTYRRLRVMGSKFENVRTELRSVGLRSLLAVVSTVLAGAACGGDDLLLPKDGEPARISAVRGDSLSGTVGQPLSDSLVAKVTDLGGRPVAGVEIVFVLPTGAVVSPADRVTTGSNGEAAIYYTLGTTAGEQIVEAHAPIVPETNAVATFRIAALPESPESLVPAGGDAQTAQVSTVLPESLAVRAVDRFGNGVEGIEVAWEPTGGGQVSPASVTTGSDGRATTALTLGASPGSYGAAARADELEGSTVAFVATAVGPVLALVIQPSTTAAAGVPLDQQPEIQLQDPFGAPLTQEGVEVTVQVTEGGGSVGGTTKVASDANGRAKFTDLELRGGTGTRTLIFAANGFTPTISAEILVRPGPPAAGQSSVSVPNGTAGERTTLTIRLRDEFGNNIAGAAEDLSISITGANPSSGLPVTESGSDSYTTSYVPVHSGRDEFSIVFRGVPLGGETSASVVAPGPADPTTTTAVVTRTGVLFVQVDIVVTTRDAHGNLLGHGGDQVEIIPNGGAPRTCAPVGQAETCVDQGDGTYVDRFILVATSISVGIRLNGVPIAGSPFTP
jgi:hypothetical protein